MTLSRSSDSLDVLLVEDDPGDIVIAEEALRAGKVASTLHVVNDGVEALEFLRQEGQHQDAPKPDLILLDLNLPKMGGHEVLSHVKNDPDLRRIPIVVLTTSQAGEDIVRSYDLYANAYVSKPVDFDDFADVVKQIDEFFASVARLSPS